MVPPEEAAKDGRQELPEGAAPDGSASPGSSESPLERLASFRFAYVAIVLALLAYVFTVEGLEAGLQAHFSDAIEAAVRVDPADGPVADQIAERVDAILRDSRWVTWGDVRVRPLVLAADGYTLLYAGGSSLPRPPPGIGGAEDAHLLPAIVDVDVSVPHNALLANVVLVFYATLLITSLVVWTRRLAARENQQLMALADTRDELASRADGIEDELQTVRRRLEEVEPENEIYAEEIDALVAERQTLQERLSELEQREDSLRAKAPSAQDLADEQRALEELLDDATRDLESRDAELEELRGQLKRAGRGGARVREDELLTRRFRALYKNLEMDDRAIADLVKLRDDGWKLRAEEGLKRLSDEPDKTLVRRKVGGLPPHLSIFELGFAGKGRVYYTKGRTRRFRILAIGAKNTQKPDLEYLSRLPRED